MHYNFEGVILIPCGDGASFRVFYWKYNPIKSSLVNHFAPDNWSAGCSGFGKAKWFWQHSCWVLSNHNAYQGSSLNFFYYDNWGSPRTDWKLRPAFTKWNFSCFFQSICFGWLDLYWLLDVGWALGWSRMTRWSLFVLRGIHWGRSEVQKSLLLLCSGSFRRNTLSWLRVKFCI